MTQWLKYGIAWLVIVGLSAEAASYFFDVGFWTAAIIAAVALIANGLFAEWEDRQPGGFYNPKGPSE